MQNRRSREVAHFKTVGGKIFHRSSVHTINFSSQSMALGSSSLHQQVLIKELSKRFKSFVSKKIKKIKKI